MRQYTAGRAVPAPALALAFALLAMPLAAQEIRGVVRDGPAGTRLEGAEVQLLDLDGVRHAAARSDADGRFRLAVPRPGRWVLAVERVGYLPVQADPVDIAAGDILEVQLRLAADAVPHEPLAVVARPGARSAAELSGFFDRMEQGRRSGIGYFMDRDDVERQGGARATDLLRSAPGVRIARGSAGRGAGLRMSGGCVPAIYVDGAHLNRIDRRESLDDYVGVLDIEGIEVYRGAAQQVAQYRDPSGCGVILVWTRRGSGDRDFTPSWITRLIIFGILGGLYFLFN